MVDEGNGGNCGMIPKIKTCRRLLSSVNFPYKSCMAQLHVVSILVELASCHDSGT